MSPAPGDDEPAPGAPLLRRAGATDAHTVAALHAESWRRHYRGAYADSFLDGDVLEDRIAVWEQRLTGEEARRLTILAEHGGPVGFVNAYFDEDPVFGTLVDNLHVLASHQRMGLGARLMAAVAEGVIARAGSRSLYLWVLEQNARAQAFYSALGGRPGEIEPVGAPGGVPGRLAGEPIKLRYIWPDATVLLGR